MILYDIYSSPDTLVRKVANFAVHFLEMNGGAFVS